jgi:hypothetical protein
VKELEEGLNATLQSRGLTGIDAPSVQASWAYWRDECRLAYTEWLEAMNEYLIEHLAGKRRMTVAEGRLVFPLKESSD